MKKLVLVVMLFLLPVSCGYSQEKTVYNLSGKAFTYKEITGAPKTILFLWTTWCPYCRKEFTRLIKEPVNTEGINFLYINISESQNKVEGYLKEVNANASLKDKIILDKDGFIAEKFHAVGIPVFLFLKNGEVFDQANFLDQETIDKDFAGGK